MFTPFVCVVRNKNRKKKFNYATIKNSFVIYCASRKSRSLIKREKQTMIYVSNQTRHFFSRYVYDCLRLKSHLLLLHPAAFQPRAPSESHERHETMHAFNVPQQQSM